MLGLDLALLLLMVPLVVLVGPLHPIRLKMHRLLPLVAQQGRLQWSPLGPLLVVVMDAQAHKLSRRAWASLHVPEQLQALRHPLLKPMLALLALMPGQAHP